MCVAVAALGVWNVLLGFAEGKTVFLFAVTLPFNCFLLSHHYTFQLDHVLSEKSDTYFTSMMEEEENDKLPEGKDMPTGKIDAVFVDVEVEVEVQPMTKELKALAVLDRSI